MKIKVGKLYQIQPKSVNLNNVVLKQDTIIEIKKIENGNVTYWNSQDQKEYTHSIL
ncbi:MAG: hypothetical protein ACTHWZ_09010 [Peptoniphilaceae bacterium]